MQREYYKDTHSGICPLTGLPIGKILVVTHVCWLLTPVEVFVVPRACWLLGDRRGSRSRLDLTASYWVGGEVSQANKTDFKPSLTKKKHVSGPPTRQ